MRLREVCPGHDRRHGGGDGAGHDHGPHPAADQAGGAQGQATEIDIVAKHILRTREKLNRILAENTGKPIEQIARDTERDNFLSAQEALDYGLVDKIFYKR